MAIKSYILIELDGVTEISFLGVLVFGYPYCLGINSTEFSVEHENTCIFPCHISSSMNNISGHVLTCNCAKKNCSIIFCVKFTIYKKIRIFQKNGNKNLFFIFLLYIPKQKNSMETPQPKRKIAIFLHLEIFVDKTTFNFHSFNKVNDFVTAQYTSAIFYPFYLNPQS